MNTFFEVASAFLALLVFILLGIMSICALTYYVGTKPACEQYGRLTGAQISTQFFGDGCLVKYEGKWVDYSVATQKKQEIKVSQ